MSIQEAIQTTHWPRWLLSILAVLSLTACAPQFSTNNWSGFISKTKNLQFIAAADCRTTLDLNPVLSDATFAQVRDLKEVTGKPWHYDLKYLGTNGWVSARAPITQIWSLEGTRSAAASAVYQVEWNACFVLVKIPVSRDAAQPYFVEPAAGKKDEYYVKGIGALIVLVVLLGVLLAALDISANGFWNPVHFLIAAAFAIGILFFSVCVASQCVQEPWWQFQRALAYQNFFDELPRVASGELLPITLNQMSVLMAGPPDPPSYQFHFAIFLAVTVIPFVIWLFALVPVIEQARYWNTHPLPLEELHERAFREGRAPTAQEITAAVLEANAGKSVWQIRIMQRKADDFAARLQEIARHL